MRRISPLVLASGLSGLVLAVALATTSMLGCAAETGGTAVPAPVVNPPTAPAPTPGRVRGRVVADSGGAPVEGADVLIPALNRSVRTDSLGR
jgi:hypothetical protein